MVSFNLPPTLWKATRALKILVVTESFLGYGFPMTVNSQKLAKRGRPGNQLQLKCQHRLGHLFPNHLY